MNRAIHPSYIRMENPNVDYEQKVIICLIDNVVVANISNFKIQGSDMIAFLPSWELLLKIFQSPNHKFIEHDTHVVEGTLWNDDQNLTPLDLQPEPQPEPQAEPQPENM